MYEIKMEMGQEDLKKLKDQIREEIRTAGQLPGVDFTNGKYGTVSFSTVIKCGKGLAVSTYSPDAQGDAVSRCIAPCNTAQELLETIQGIAEAGHIEFQDEQVNLNENTIKVLSTYLK